MKLDKDLMRDILLAVEAHPEPSANYVPLDLPEHDAEVVSYHVMLLVEGGFLKAMDVSDKSQLEWYPQRLTYSGHECVATIRDGEIWGKTKAVASKVGGVSRVRLGAGESGGQSKARPAINQFRGPASRETATD